MQVASAGDAALTPHHCKALGTECLDWWEHRGHVRGAAQPPPASPREGGRAAPGTAPAWDLELDPKAPSGIVALTQHLCFLCRRL